MLLKKYCKIKKITQRNAAKEIGVKLATFRGWIYGHRTPRLSGLNMIKKWSGGEVTANDFYASNEETEEKR